MAILIPPNILMKTAARFTREKIIKENIDDPAPPGREAHIYNLYEDLAMPLSGIIDIAKLALDGKLENIQEKVDGQNITFTVKDGVLRFFTKMSLVSERDLSNARSKIQADRGMDLALINEKYADKPGIVAAFSLGYEALEPIALQFQDSLFRNGDVVVVSGLITSVNPNTIIYDADSFRFITPVSLTENPVDQVSYEQFLQQASSATTEAFTMDSVPTAKLIDDLETDDAEIEMLVRDLESVVGDTGLSVASATVGDYVAARVEKLLREKYSFIPEEMIADVANRFMTGRGAVANRLKRLVSTEDYQRFRQLDALKPEVVAEAIIPLENVIQRLGAMIIDKLDLTLTASNQNDLLTLVRQARDAFSKGEILADEKTLEKIRVALSRLEENEELFTRATEGIVFTYNGRTYKLTGLFTPINRLRGFFAYGAARLPQSDTSGLNEVTIRAVNRFILEGGGAFKDSDGAVLTTDIDLENVEPTLSDFFINHLKPLGIDLYRMLGSTGKKSRSGDLDIVIRPQSSQDTVASDDASRIKKFKKMLVGNLKLSVTDGDVKLVGANVGVMYPIAGSQPGEYVQIDIMINESPDDMAWLMSGTGDVGIKGVYRNLMLSYIARRRSDEMSPREKVTLSFPGGLERKILPQEFDPEDPKSRRKWQSEGPKVTSPTDILDVLGVPGTPDDVDTFSGLVRAMVSDSDLSAYLPGFEEYISRYLQSDASREHAEKAVTHVRDAISDRSNEILAEMYLRKMIRFIS